MEKTHVPLYTLNDYLKFDRKIYQVFGLPLGRPISLKSVMYALAIGFVELVIYFTPIIGKLINWIPVGILIVIPIGGAWLLTDIGTEDRSPLSFFKSFILYQLRKVKKDSAYRGRTVAKKRTYTFNNYFYRTETEKITHQVVVDGFKMAEKERSKTLRFLERMHNPDDFFAKLKEEQHSKKKRYKWLLLRRKGDSDE